MANFFISYSRRNQPFVETLQQAIKLGRYSCWRDVTDLEGSLRFSAEIRRAIDCCSIFMPIISPDFHASEICMKELKYAQDTHKTVFPILLEGTTPCSLSSTHYIRVPGGNCEHILACSLLSVMQQISKFAGDPNNVDQHFSTDSDCEWPDDDLEVRLMNTTWSWCDNEHFQGDKWIEFRPANRVIRSWNRSTPQAWSVTGNQFVIFGKHVLSFDFETNSFQGAKAIPGVSNVERSGKFLRRFEKEGDLP